uniref:Uncharacterized protein n=1 Tax=Anguilla anguilla TaxID=7936 RepID=A0A0E9TBH9_ANGAN
MTWNRVRLCLRCCSWLIGVYTQTVLALHE